MVAVGGCGRISRVNERTHVDTNRDSLRQLVTAARPPMFVTRDKQGTRLWTLTRQFYQKHEYHPVWIEGRTPKPAMNELLATLGQASADGLDPALYNVSLLDERREAADKGFLLKAGIDEPDVARLDAWLTYLYLQYSSDLTNGLADLSSADPDWRIPGDAFDPLATLDRAIEKGHVAASLQELEPHDSQYAAMKAALAHYRDLAAKGGWGTLPVSLKVKPGQHHALVPALAKRLSVTGDFTGALPDGTLYDGAVQAAVKRFQKRHGLEPDAVVGANVVAQLNVPAAARVRQLELNLERWRWLPRDLGGRYIFVNVPEYRLEVHERGQTLLTMRVVVGKQDTPTPIFADDMSYLVFAPYWNVPPDIVEKETLPSVMRDPAFLEKTNMEIVDRKGHPIDPASVDLSKPGDYRFRQRPGETNSLGLVKFMFPNQYNVYLHDTPADSLFGRATRSLSHGCVRLEDPAELAQYVLRDQPQWTPDRIAEAMHGTDEKVVKLREKIPVYIAYFTARVSPDGQVQFRRDIYDIDAQQSARVATVLAKLRAHAAATEQAARAEKAGSVKTGAVKAAF